MKHVLILFLLALSALLPGTVLAYDFEVDGIYYNINGNEAAVTNKVIDPSDPWYNGDAYSGDVIIPESVTFDETTYPVTSIDNEAFSWCVQLTSVTIPNSVSAIGDGAFCYCPGMTSILIPNTVTSIGDYLFAGCESLTSVSLPNTITSIGVMMFQYCSSLSCITIPNSVTSICALAFEGCTSLTNIEIPSSVVSIKEEAFRGCTALNDLEIPSSVTYVGSQAFDETGWYNSQQDGLVYVGKIAYKYKGTMQEGTNITIKEGTVVISDCAFTNCTGLSSLYLPNTVASIGFEAFTGCTELTNLNIPTSITSVGWNAFEGTAWYNNQPDGLVYVGRVAYKYKGTIPQGTSITIDNGTVSITSMAFSNSTGLTGIVLPNSLRFIGNSTFSGCSGLTSVIIPDSVESIGSHVFEDCRNLCSINIPRSVTIINDNVFNNCYRLSSISLPKSIKSIGSRAFEDCRALTSIIIPDSVTSIGEAAFLSCSNLTNITIPPTVTTMGEYVFSGCHMLSHIFINDLEAWCKIKYSSNPLLNAHHLYLNGSEIVDLIIPNSIYSIGKYNFFNCSYLGSILIPNSVKKIDSSAFIGCNGTIAVVDDNPKYDSRGNCNAIIETSSNTLIKGCKDSTIPNTVTSIGPNAFDSCSDMFEVTIPNSVTSIGVCAFYNCTSLNEIYCHIMKPSSIIMGSNVFYRASGNYAERTLYVPYGTLSAYQADNKWSQYFGNIVEKNPVPASSIELDKTAAVVIEGESLQLLATVIPENETVKVVLWATSNPAVATVDSTGVVTAVGLGTATITAMTTDGTNLSASCMVTVKSLSSDNCFILDDAEVLHGETITIPVALTNAETVLAFQTDIYLPEGFTIVTGIDGLYAIAPSSRLTDDHVIMTQDVSNGSVRVICYTPSTQPINGNEGELFYITIQVPEDAAGDYAIYLRNSRLTTADYTEERIHDVGAVLTVNTFIPGDANDSHTVTVTDIVVTAQYILEMHPDPFIFDAADMNGDGEVTVTDIMLIARLILYPDAMIAPRQAPISDSYSDRLSGYDITLAPGETRTVAIALDNETAYCAFQFDLSLPNGITANNIQVTDRAGNHMFDMNMLSNDKVRVLCYSPVIAAISGREGILLTFDVTTTGIVNGDITVDGIEFVTIDCQTVSMDAFTISVNSVTSVNEMNEGKTVANVVYYNIAGQRLEKPESGMTFVVTTYTDGSRSVAKQIR